MNKQHVRLGFYILSKHLTYGVCLKAVQIQVVTITKELGCDHSKHIIGNCESE